MTPLPLEQIGLRWRDHCSALWWLGILYRRPQQLRKQLEALPKFQALHAGSVLYLHALPYILILSIIGRLLLFGSLGLELREHQPAEWSALVLAHSALLIRGIAEGISVGIGVGIIAWIIAGSSGGMAIGIGIWMVIGIGIGTAGGISVGATGGIIKGIGIGVFAGIFARIFGGIAFGIDEGIGVWIGVGIGTGTAFGITFGIFGGIAFGIASLRAYYHPFCLFFTWPTLQGRWYPWHPVAWDDLCSLPFPRLDRLLAAYADHDPTAARTEIERLIDHYPSQRMAALRAKTRLIARTSAQEKNLSRLNAHLAQLPEGDKGFLAQTPKVRAIVGEIGQLQIRLDTLDRPFLREPTAALLVEKIKNFQSQVAGFPEPLASEFRQAAGQWLVIAERQYQQIRSVLDKEPTPQVFRAGDPVDRNQEAFIPRESVLGDLDRQLTLSTGCPGLILYGRRPRVPQFEALRG